MKKYNVSINSKLLSTMQIFIIISGLSFFSYISAQRTQHVSIINYTDKKIIVTYRSPEQNAVTTIKSVEPNNQTSFNIKGTSDGISYFLTGTIKVRYGRRTIQFENPKFGLTYQVTLAQNGDPVIEGSSSFADTKVRLND